VVRQRNRDPLAQRSRAQSGADALQETALLLEPRRDRLHMVRSAQRRLRQGRRRTQLRHGDQRLPAEAGLLGLQHAGGAVPRHEVCPPVRSRDQPLGVRIHGWQRDADSGVGRVRLRFGPDAGGQIRRVRRFHGGRDGQRDPAETAGRHGAPHHRTDAGNAEAHRRRLGRNRRETAGSLRRRRGDAGAFAQVPH